MATTLTANNEGKINERTFTEPADQKTRFLGLSLLVTQIGVMVGYGVAGQFRNESLNGISVLQNGIIGLILMFLFVSVGFGMLLNIYRFGNWLGSSIVILVLAVSIQLGPLLQKLFISIIITGFGARNQNFDTTTTVSTWINNISNGKIDIGILLMRTVFLSVISIMTVMSAVVGRVGTVQIVKFASLFQIFWVINYFLLAYFLTTYNDFNGWTSNPYFFDMFGTTYVYLFAVFFGLPFSCLLKRQALPEIHPRNQFNRISLLLSQIGSGILAATFVFTSCYIVNYTLYGNYLGDNYARFSIIFGIIGSIVGTFIGSALVGKGRVGYKQVLTGSITGAVVMGSAAPIVTNIGIIIMIGSVTGFLNGIYMRVIHVRINRDNVKDVLGLFGPFAIASILGSFVVTPSVLTFYYNRGYTFPFSNKITIPSNYAGYQLIYVGLSAGIGLVGGLLTSIFNICDKDYFALASNSRIYLNDFGLYDLGKASKSLQALPAHNQATPTPADQVLFGQSQAVLVKSGVLM